MTWTRENINYCLLSFDAYQHDFYQQFASKSPAITGLFQWVNAFGGAMDFPRTPEQFSKYNLVHLNISARNLWLMPKLKGLLPKSTKLLINVDYAIELWANNFPAPELFLQELNKADYIFAVEPKMARLLSHALNRNVPCIPHPCDTEGVAKLATTDRKRMITVNVHRYDKNYLLPWYALQDLNKNEWVSALAGGAVNAMDVAHLYDMVIPHLGYPDMCKHIAESWLCYDPYSVNSYGRFAIDCAALAVPCICSSMTQSGHTLFPLTTIDPYDVTTAKRLIHKLTEDEDFYREVAEYANEAVEFYSLDNCADMMIDFLNQGENYVSSKRPRHAESAFI